MARIVEKTVYQFNELSDRSKDKAREHFRSINDFDPEFDDFIQVATILGITFKEDKKGGARILYSGFSSQGVGACYEGTYAANKDAPKLIREYAPQDEVLHRLADALDEIQKANNYDVAATCWHTDPHYYHCYTMGVDVTLSNGEPSGVEGTAEKVVGVMRHFANWIYKQLNDEYDHEQSNEYVDECMADDQEFYEDGTPFGG